MSKRAKARPQIAPAVKHHLAQAREDLSIAERELKSTLDSLPLALRADKQMVSNALRLALDKLSAARERVESVLGD